jgi:hypothetical protein
VLGLSDGDDARDTVMVRGVDLARVDAIVPTTADYYALADEYAYVAKQALSLVTPAGACVGASAAATGSGLAGGACRPVNPQAWSAPTNRLELWMTPPELCATQPLSGEAVALSPCGLERAAGDFYMPSVKWRTPTACVSADSSVVSAGTGLVTAACTAADDPLEAFYFEILDVIDGGAFDGTGFVARIHLVGKNLCVAVASGPAAGPRTLVLDDCSLGAAMSDPQVFELARDLPASGALHSVGTIRAASTGAVVDWPLDGGNLYLADEAAANSAWLVSGALLNDAGLLLTQAADGTVVAAPFAEPPPVTQLFDFYF